MAILFSKSKVLKIILKLYIFQDAAEVIVGQSRGYVSRVKLVNSLVLDESRRSRVAAGDLLILKYSTL